MQCTCIDRIDTDLAAVTAAVKEKEGQIVGLMEEGERLSKQQLQNSNTIKKLRTSSKQDQQLIASQKLDDMLNLLSSLHALGVIQE
jgi:predicted  nucleic acid-binding Zn-ribbon protein